MLKKDNERACLFFASDYHFEMISLPFINKNMKENKDIIIVTENDLDETVKKLLSNVNMNTQEKENIIKIDWKNNDINKLKKIKKLNDSKKEAIIFVKGQEKYIKNVNENIRDCINSDDIQIINCYDINEIENEITDITKDYTQILSTSGIKKL